MEQKNTLFEAEVQDLISDGRGVIKHPSGRTYFAPGVWPGEIGTFRVLELRGKIGIAERVELSRQAPERVDPPCRFHRVSLNASLGESSCGGCPWQFIDYSAQLAAKNARVLGAFARIGVSDRVASILPSPKTLGYRNRAQFKTDGKHIGFVSAGSNTLAPIDDCVVLTDKNRDSLKRLSEKLPQKDWMPARKKQWTTLDIDEFTDVEQVSVNARLPFMQANAEQNNTMRAWLSKKLQGLAQDSGVLELFCGSGNFTEVIAECGFDNIVAAEAVTEAIAELEQKKLSNVTGICANVYTEEGLARVLSKSRDARALVLDPPRDGLKMTTGLFSKKSRLRDIFYISCDIATLVRDVKMFQEQRFKVKDVQPLDLFPHTPHIECMVHLRKS